MSRVARILVVDDEEGIRTSLRTALEMSGYDVTEASDGQIALGLYRESADLVITDMEMAGKDGLETIRDLRAENPDLKIISVAGDR